MTTKISIDITGDARAMGDAERCEYEGIAINVDSPEATIRQTAHAIACAVNRLAANLEYYGVGKWDITEAIDSVMVAVDEWRNQ